MDIRKPTPSGKTTILAMVISVFGAIMVFVPWLHLTHFGERNGLVSWHGIVILIFLITLFLFLVATSPLKPVPLWRSLPLIGVGFFVLLFTGLFFGQFSAARPEAGVYLEFISGFLLLLVGALEIRGHLIRWQQGQASRVAMVIEDTIPHEDEPRPGAQPHFEGIQDTRTPQ